MSIFPGTRKRGEGGWEWEKGKEGEKKKTSLISFDPLLEQRRKKGEGNLAQKFGTREIEIEQFYSVVRKKEKGKPSAACESGGRNRWLVNQ